MKSRKKPSLIARPNDPVSMDEVCAFAQLLIPIYELEWERVVTSPKPNWDFALHLHLRLVQLEQGTL